jgi:hypothetical protein
MEEWRYSPIILHLGTKRWAVSFTTRPLYPQGKNLRYPLDRRMGVHQTRSGCCDVEKNHLPCWESNPVCSVRSPSLCRLSYRDSHSFISFVITAVRSSHLAQISWKLYEISFKQSKIIILSQITYYDNLKAESFQCMSVISRGWHHLDSNSLVSLRTACMDKTKIPSAWSWKLTRS